MIACKKASRNFRTNHNVGSSLRQQKKLSKSFRANETFGYSELLSSAPDSKTETGQNGEKLTMAVQVLQEVSVTFPGAQNFFNEKLEQKCANEFISVEEVIFHCLALLVMKVCL